MIRHILLMLVFFWSLTVYAQAYRNGLLVTENGDTLKGLVYQSGQLIYYKPVKMSESVSFKIDNLAYYQIGEERYRCESVEVLKGRFPEFEFICLELEIRGPVSLWRGEPKDVYGNPWENYYIEKEGYQIVRIWKSKRFRKQASWIFEDYTDLSMRIRSGELTYEELGEIVREYNSWKTSQPNS